MDETSADLCSLFNPGRDMRTSTASGVNVDFVVGSSSDEYWHSRPYPTGAGPATIAAGTYTINVYVTTVPTATITWQAEVGYCDDGCDAAGDYNVIVTSSNFTYDGSTALGLHSETIGFGAAQTYTAANPTRLYMRIKGVSGSGGFEFGINGSAADYITNFETPAIDVASWLEPYVPTVESSEGVDAGSLQVDGSARMTITADLAPGQDLLARTTAEGTKVDVLPDPVGFALLEPQAPGRQEIVLEYHEPSAVRLGYLIAAVSVLALAVLALRPVRQRLAVAAAQVVKRWRSWHAPGRRK